MKVKEKWTPVHPAPTLENTTLIIHPSLGKPTKIWCYIDSDGHNTFYVCRWDHVGQNKKVLPYSYGDFDGHTGWHWKWIPDIRPLFNLSDVLNRSSDTVVLSEGEKAAEEGQKLFPEFIFTTSSGGSNSANKSDFTPLKNRDLIIFRDNDEAGLRYQNEVCILLRNLNVKSIRTVEIPNDFPPKWDLADPLPANYSLQDIRRLIETAIEFNPVNEAPPIELPIDWTKDLRTTCLAEVEPEEIDWLWMPYIPRGCLTMCDGDPGLGKSHVTLAIASALSNGKPLPMQDKGSIGTTLLVSCEDSLSQTIKPRLVRLKANCDLIHCHDSPLTLDDDGVSKLRAAVGRLRPDLIVIDPIVAYVGGSTDTNSANKVRAILAPLAKLASDHGCAIIFVRHLNKNFGNGSLLYRGMGSIDFIAAARSGLSVSEHPHDKSQRVMLHIKSNLAKSGSSVGFTFENDCFKWTGKSDITERDLGVAHGNDRSRAPARDEAIHFLQDFLADGERPAMDVIQAAKMSGIAKNTLDRAKLEIKIIAKKSSGSNGQWLWSLPTLKDTQQPPVENVEYDGDLGDDDKYDEDTFVDIDKHLEHLQDIQDTYDIDPMSSGDLSTNDDAEGHL
jgi:AAA domain